MRYVTTLLLFSASISLTQAQDYNLAKLSEEGKITVYNRNLSNSSASFGEVYMDAEESDGLALLEGVSFSKGTIEVQIKGENNPGKSFVGIAFNVRSREEYECVYFRPFNFVADEEIRRSHMLQYIFHPEFTWRKLRETRTDEFENKLQSPPDPDDWFDIRIVVTEKEVKVFVNKETQPSLEIERLTSGTSDRLALWTGFGSKGAYRNLTITHK